jgi:hypothetical protein
LDHGVDPPSLTWESVEDDMKAAGSPVWTPANQIDVFALQQDSRLSVPIEYPEIPADRCRGEAPVHVAEYAQRLRAAKHQPELAVGV